MDRGYGLARRPIGIAGLWRLIRTAWAPLEADFARYYHLELPELVFGPNQRVPLRRLSVLITHLPADSAFLRFVADELEPLPAPWSTGDHLLALVAELIDKTNRILEAVYTKAGSKAPKPLRIPRPGEELEPEEPVAMDTPEARAFFGAGRVDYTPPPPSESD